MRPPGEMLRTAAARVCSTRTLERLVDPIVGDMQIEHAEAMRAGRRWRAARIRAGGYAACWKALGLHAIDALPRALWQAFAADGTGLGRTIACSLTLFVVLSLALAAWPIVADHPHSRILVLTLILALPQAIPLSVPTAVSLGIVAGYGRNRGTSIRGAVVLLFAGALVAFAALLAIPDANQAFRVAMAQQLGARGITSDSLPRGANELSLSELSARSKAYEASGSPKRAREFRWTFHLRFALPTATIVLGLLALGVAAAVRHRALQLLAIVTGICLYWALMVSAQAIETLPIAVSVWTPNLVVAAIAASLLKIAPTPSRLA